MICKDEVAAGEYVCLIDVLKGLLFSVGAKCFCGGVVLKLQPQLAPAAAPVRKERRCVLSVWGAGS